MPGVAVDAAAQGTGRTVVFANDSGNSACDWLFLANEFVARGYRTVVFAYADPSADAEPQALHDLLDLAERTDGGHP